MPKKRDRDGIYERKDRAGFWASWTDASGRRRQRKLQAHTLQQARSLLNAEKARVEKIVTLGYTPPTQEVLSVVAVRFLKHQQARLTGPAYEREVGILHCHIEPILGKTKKLASIRRADIQSYVTRRSGEVASATVTKELNVLKHLLSLAVQWELLPSNPATGIKPPKAPAGRIRYLQPTELRAVLDNCPVWLRPIALLAATTGMRRGEILGLRWLDVDLSGERVLLPQTKNGQGRIVYLNELAKDALRSLDPSRASADERLFCGDQMTPSNVSLAFLRACRRTKIVDFRFHDLRHTAASWMRMSGADIHTVALLLGHKDLRMAARYQHLSPAYLSEAVKMLDIAFKAPPALPQPAEEGAIVTTA